MNSTLKGKKVSFADSDFRTAQNSEAGCTTGGTFDCVAVAMKDGVVAVRSSYDNEKVTALFSNDEWKCFLAGAKAGQFDI